MDRKFWAGMRENDFILVDAEKRKIAVFANQSGELVFASEEDGGKCIATICPEEFSRLDELIRTAKHDALEIDRVRSAEYAAYEAVCKAAGHR